MNLVYKNTRFNDCVCCFCCILTEPSDLMEDLREPMEEVQ